MKLWTVEVTFGLDERKVYLCQAYTMQAGMLWLTNSDGSKEVLPLEGITSITAREVKDEK